MRATSETNRSTEMNYAAAFTSSLCLLLMLATVPIAYREARPRSSVAYGCGFMVLGIGALVLALPDAVAAYSIAFTLFTIAAALGGALLLLGTWLRCGARLPYGWLAAGAIVWLISIVPLPYLERLPYLRAVTYGLCLATGCALAVWAIMRKKARRNAADRMLIGTFVFAGVSELLLTMLTFMHPNGAEEVWSIRGITVPLTLVGLGIFVLQSYALDSIDELNRLSETDALTELMNRRAFNERLDQTIETAKRYRRPLCLVIADLDNFKRINDRFGHTAGDDVLVAFGQLLREQSRSVDAVARIGGEEFAIIMPESGVDDVLDYAERMRAATEARVRMQEEPVTASFGIADAADCSYDARALIAAADAALYAAKAAGRNRVLVHNVRQGELFPAFRGRLSKAG
jgi:diguanylate cyclase (GGDEF)-like protein